MRIECSACGEIHDSDVFPFKHNNVKATNERRQVLNTNLLLPNLVLNIKEAEAKFVCKHCLAPNFIVLRWQSIVEEDKNKS
jgi:hypothetical protein